MYLSKKFLRRPGAAEHLRKEYGFGSARTLAKLASTGGGPAYHKIGGIVVYALEDLDAWVASRMKRQTSTGAAKKRGAAV